MTELIIFLVKLIWIPLDMNNLIMCRCDISVTVSFYMSEEVNDWCWQKVDESLYQREFFEFVRSEFFYDIFVLFSRFKCQVELRFIFNRTKEKVISIKQCHTIMHDYLFFCFAPNPNYFKTNHLFVCVMSWFDQVYAFMRTGER